MKNLLDKQNRMVNTVLAWHTKENKKRMMNISLTGR